MWGLELGSRIDLSMAVTSMFALILGVAALIAIVQVESSGYKAEQEFRNHLVSLRLSIGSVISKIGLAYKHEHLDDLSFDSEIETIKSISHTPSMLGIIAWAEEQESNSQEASGNFKILDQIVRLECWLQILNKQEKIEFNNGYITGLVTAIVEDSKSVNDLLSKIDRDEITQISSKIVDVDGLNEQYNLSSKRGLSANVYDAYNRAR